MDWRQNARNAKRLTTKIAPKILTEPKRARLTDKPSEENWLFVRYLVVTTLPIQRNEKQEWQWEMRYGMANYFGSLARFVEIQ